MKRLIAKIVASVMLVACAVLAVGAGSKTTEGITRRVTLSGNTISSLLWYSEACKTVNGKVGYYAKPVNSGIQTGSETGTYAKWLRTQTATYANTYDSKGTFQVVYSATYYTSLLDKLLQSRAKANSVAYFNTIICPKK